MRILITISFLSIFIRGQSQTDTIVWQQLSPLPTSNPTIGSAYFLIDSDFYVAGGWIGAPNGIPTNGVWKYHIPSDQWSQLGNIPFGGAATSCTFVLNGKGYFLIARDSVNNGNCDTMFWEYNPTLDSWTIRAGFPDAPRQQSSNFVYGGKGYVGQTVGCSIGDTHFWQYDPILDQWSQVATLPTDNTAGSIAIATLTADAYLFGGEDIGGNFLNDIWRYSITSNHWDSIGQMPGSGRFFPVFWGFDSVIIGGGGVGDTSINNDFYLYNFSMNTWSPIVFQNFMDSAYYGAAFIWGKNAYYFGGPTDLLQTTHNIGMWSFDASTFFPADTSTGISAVRADATFSLYPNPVGHGQGFSISTSESGSISFYDALGQVLDERKLLRGMNTIRLSTTAEVVFYRATLQDGRTENGKLVIIK